MKDFISKKQIVKLREFLRQYYGINCNWRGKMTHHRMDEFLKEKGKRSFRGKLCEITLEQKLRGDYIYVQDEMGFVVPYQNPLRRANMVIRPKVKKLEEIRRQILNEQGYTYNENGEVITLEEYQQALKEKEEMMKEEQQQDMMDCIVEYYEKQASHNRYQKVKSRLRRIS